MTGTANSGPLNAAVSAAVPEPVASSIPVRRLLPGPTVESATDEQLLQWYAPPATVDNAAAWVRFNFISSLDGSATLRGLSGGLASPADKRIFNLLRWSADIILIGAQTLRAEGYAGYLLDRNGMRWRLDHGLTTHPVPAVVSGSLQLDPTSLFFTEAPVKPIVATSRESSPERRRQFGQCADLIVSGEQRVDIDLLLSEIAGRGHRQILCEGGPHLFGSFQQAGRVDELCLSLSPTLVAGQDMRIAISAAADRPAAAPMALQHVLACGDMLFMRYVAGSGRIED